MAKQTVTVGIANIMDGSAWAFVWPGIAQQGNGRDVARVRCDLPHAETALAYALAEYLGRADEPPETIVVYGSHPTVNTRRAAVNALTWAGAVREED